jgi:hypothetical protein
MLSWFIVFRFGARAFVVVLFGAVVVLFRVLRFVLAMVGVIAVNSTLSGNNITLNANNNIKAAGVNIQADNSISGTAKDINIQKMLSWFVVFRFGARAFVMVLFGAVVVLFRVLRFVLAMVEVVARVVIKVKIDITNGFGI